MAQIPCDDCLKTYEPYKFSETLQRASISGTDEWKGDDDEYHIKRKYSDLSYTLLGFTGTIKNLFSSVEDFNNCCRNFNMERRKNISSSLLCFDCEKYLCAKCIRSTRRHSDHFSFSEEDKNNVDKWDKIETQIMQKFDLEGNNKETYIKEERAVLCDVIDVRGFMSELDWKEFLSRKVYDINDLENELDKSNSFFGLRDMCILNDNKTLLITNMLNNSIQLYSINNGKMSRSIKLTSSPWGLTEIPWGLTEIPLTDISQSLIAVSFPREKRIDIMNIDRDPAQVISSIKVKGICRDLAFCNNKFVTWCVDFKGDNCFDSIHVMNMSGEIINIIDLNKLPGIQSKGLFNGRMSVHAESEIIYVGHYSDLSSLIGLSFDGQVIHSKIIPGLTPDLICVDNDRHVYVTGVSLPVYKLSSDFSKKMEIIDRCAANITKITSIIHQNNRIFIASRARCVHIFSLV